MTIFGSGTYDITSSRANLISNSLHTIKSDENSLEGLAELFALDICKDDNNFHPEIKRLCKKYPVVKQLCEPGFWGKYGKRVPSRMVRKYTLRNFIPYECTSIY